MSHASFNELRRGTTGPSLFNLTVNLHIDTKRTGCVVFAVHTIPNALDDRSPTTMMRMTEQAYRGAVALNNWGCSLLEKGCARQARTTFQDAVTLLRAASTQRKKKPATHEDIEGIIDLATQRYAMPSRDTEVPTFFVTVSLEACCSSYLHDLSTGHTSFSRSILICIEDYGDLDVDSSIILHNYSISLLYLASICRDINESRRHCESALQVLDLCHLVLIRKYKGLPEAPFAFNHRVVTVDYVATYTLLQALCLKWPPTISQSNNIFRKLLILHSQLQLLEGSEAHGHAPAA
jgi:hypothetical protein